MINIRPVLFIQANADAQVTSPVIGTGFTASGTPVFGTGKFLNAYQGDNTSNYYSFNVSNYLSNWDEMSVVFDWQPSAGFNVTTNVLFDFYNGSGNPRIAIESSPGTGLFRYRRFVQDVVSYDIVSYSLSNFSAGTWYHIACVQNRAGIAGSADTARLYVDGTEVHDASDAHASDTWANAAGAGLGIDTSHTAPLIGLIDNIQFYNVELTNFRHRHFNASQILK